MIVSWNDKGVLEYRSIKVNCIRCLLNQRDLVSMGSVSRLPYSTDSHFHPLIFVFVSWSGGGNPPLAEQKTILVSTAAKKCKPGLIFCDTCNINYINELNEDLKKLPESSNL